MYKYKLIYIYIYIIVYIYIYNNASRKDYPNSLASESSMLLQLANGLADRPLPRPWSLPDRPLPSLGPLLTAQSLTLPIARPLVPCGQATPRPLTRCCLATARLLAPGGPAGPGGGGPHLCPETTQPWRCLGCKGHGGQSGVSRRGVGNPEHLAGGGQHPFIGARS